MNGAAVSSLAVVVITLVGCSSSARDGRPGTGGTAGAGVVGSGGISSGGAFMGPGGESGGRASAGASGGFAGNGGVAGDAGGLGGESTAVDAEPSRDAAADFDAPVCPACPPIACPYGSPVDSNGCAACTCNPAPDGGVDHSLDSACAGCADASRDASVPIEAGQKWDVGRMDAWGIKCGNHYCAWDEHCCGVENPEFSPTGPTCAPASIWCI